MKAESLVTTIMFYGGLINDIHSEILWWHLQFLELDRIVDNLKESRKKILTILWLWESGEENFSNFFNILFSDFESGETIYFIPMLFFNVQFLPPKLREYVCFNFMFLLQDKNYNFYCLQQLKSSLKLP